MQAGVPAGAVTTVPQAFAQTHTAYRDMLIGSEGHRAPRHSCEAHTDAR